MLTDTILKENGFECISISRDGGTKTYRYNKPVINNNYIVVRVNSTNPLTPKDSTVTISKLNFPPKDREFKASEWFSPFTVLWTGHCTDVITLINLIHNHNDNN